MYLAYIPCLCSTVIKHPKRKIYSKQLLIMSMTIFCCSSVIFISLGRHRPLLKISAATSVVSSAEINLYPSKIGCICIGFQIGRDSMLYLASVSLISSGQDLPLQETYSQSSFPLFCSHIASEFTVRQLSQKLGFEQSRNGFI